jgi:hypothetical protein
MAREEITRETRKEWLGGKRQQGTSSTKEALACHQRTDESLIW